MSFWREWYIIREHQLSRVLRISCTFYYLVASSACFVQMMTIQVIAEREQKIQSEVKEIKKAFYCNLCNKQYKLAMEFESHLSSYDHNHRKVTTLFYSSHGLFYFIYMQLRLLFFFDEFTYYLLPQTRHHTFIHILQALLIS